jgi:hypothetical protein
MNIFFLYMCAVKAAQAQCDKHVVKMPLEVAQMLCAVWRKLHGQMTKTEARLKRRKIDPNVAEAADRLGLYKLTHSNHPMTVWVGESMENFEWALQHGIALCAEWKRRWHSNDAKEHGSSRIFTFMQENKQALKELFPKQGFTAPPQCMPDQYKVEGDAVAAYRAYYRGEKASFATWKFSNRPEFWDLST